VFEVLYFAYGSNLCTARMKRRVPGARVVGTGYVEGRRLVFHKRGRDGSGKADAPPAAGSRVWGVVYGVAPEDRATLDRAEAGYRAVEVEVVSASGLLTAFLYQALPGNLDASLRPYAWYKAYLVDGAREHGLPSGYRAALEELEAVEDPDRDRDERNRHT
jgi:gamma-glutamylcyclotransferase